MTAPAWMPLAEILPGDIGLEPMPRIQRRLARPLPEQIDSRLIHAALLLPMVQVFGAGEKLAGIDVIGQGPRLAIVDAAHGPIIFFDADHQHHRDADDPILPDFLIPHRLFVDHLLGDDQARAPMLKR